MAATTGAAPWCAGDAGVEPLIPTDETPEAATTNAIVTAFIRFGVSQVRCCACSHARAPLAPAVAAMMQPAHMPAA